MRISRIFGLALRSARSQLVATVLVMVVTGLLCGWVLANVGRSAALENRLLAEMEEPGSRVLSVRDTSDAGFINTTTIEPVQGLSVSETALGVGIPRDARHGQLDVAPRGLRRAGYSPRRHSLSQSS